MITLLDMGMVRPLKRIFFCERCAVEPKLFFATNAFSEVISRLRRAIMNTVLSLALAGKSDIAPINSACPYKTNKACVYFSQRLPTYSMPDGRPVVYR